MHIPVGIDNVKGFRSELPIPTTQGMEFGVYNSRSGSELVLSAWQSVPFFGQAH